MKKWIVIGSIFLLFLLYVITFNMKPGTVTAASLIPFDENGFVDAQDLSNTDKLAGSNTRYNLYLDETTSHFKVVDTLTNTVWESNPSGMDPWQLDSTKFITASALERQKATLEISYFNEKGSVTTLNNYNYSIYHPKSVLYNAGLRTYSIKYIDNGFQVLYNIEDVDIDYLYFPKYLTPEVIESLPDKDLLLQLAYTGYDEDLGVYEITQYEDMSRLVRSRLYDIFYGDDGLGYTRERAIEENASYGYTDTFDKVHFTIAIQVELTDTGVITSIVHNSITESGNAKLASVTLYPYFGTAVSEIDGVETSGYMVLPDGSGAVIEFNNGKNYQQPYSKGLYGVDLALMDHKMPETQQKISIPLYGMVKENEAFAAIITQGDAMAVLHADVSGRVDSYNKIYTSFNLRENESVTLGSGFNQYGLDLWTKDIVTTDCSVMYTFIHGEDANYVGIANVYKKYLEENNQFDQVDTTTNTQLTTELLGAYDQKSFLFGVPYYREDSLTTFDQAQTILEALENKQVTDINVMYRGIFNGGLSSSVNDSFDVEKVLGGQKKYTQLEQYTSTNNIDMYPIMSVMSTSDYNKIFDKYRYTTSRIDGSLSRVFTYHLPSKLPYSETPFEFFEDDYVISPLYYETILNRFLGDYDGSTIAYDRLGSTLAGSYNDNALYRQDSLRVQQSILTSTSTTQTLVSSPLGFAIPYVDYAVDIPVETTFYAIIDYQIPLLQLVLSGKIDYTSTSMNLSNERSTEYSFLKALETGSNLKYTLSYDDSTKLKDTKYNYYISTQYENWINQIAEQVATMDAIGLHQGHLVNHEYLGNNVYRVTYSNGVQIVINYNLQNVDYGIQTIPAMDYLVLGGGLHG